MRFLNNNEIIVHTRGFSLIETLVAIGVLTTALLGPLTLANYSIRSATLSQNAITGYNLAQEGMEFMRNRRDSNFIQGSGGSWTQGFGPCISGNCGVDAGTGQIDSCSNFNNCVLKFNSASGLYGYASGNSSIFTRAITISNIADYDSDGTYDEIRAIVTVSWKERTYTKNLTLETHLFRWK